MSLLERYGVDVGDDTAPSAGQDGGAAGLFGWEEREAWPSRSSWRLLRRSRRGRLLADNESMAVYWPDNLYDFFFFN
jgi:hypothetical protein